MAKPDDPAISELVSQQVVSLRDRWIAGAYPNVRCVGDINMGPCSEFAEELQGELLEIGIEGKLRDSVDMLADMGLSSGDYHAWLDVDGIAHDAGCPEGAPADCLNTNVRILRGAEPVIDGSDEDLDPEDVQVGPRPF